MPDAVRPVLAAKAALTGVVALALSCTFALASSSGTGALDEIPADVRPALARGEVVTLASETRGCEYMNRVATLVDGDPAAILAEIRDYAQLRRIFPELKALSFDRGSDHDSLIFALKVHPLLPAISFEKGVTWQFHANGDAEVDIALLSSDQRRVESQEWEFTLKRVDDGRTLLLYETTDRYAGVVGKQRLLTKLHDFTARFASDVRARTVARGSATQVGGQ